MHFSRRSFLRGLGASSALLPFWNPWIREAYGAQGAPRRIIIYMMTHGVREAFKPTPGPSPSQFNLGSFRALEPHRQDMMVLSDFYNPFNLHLHGNRWSLSVDPGVPVQGTTRPLPGGPTFDRYLAQQVGQSNAVDSASVALWYGKKGSLESADGKNKVFPSISNSLSLFEKLFGMPDASASQGVERLAKGKSVLDAVRGDLSALSSRLSSSEKEKLDRYTGSIQQLEERMRKLVQSQGSCTPVNPYTPEQLGDRDNVREEDLDLALSTAVQAVACDLTRVVLLNVNTSQSKFDFIDTKGVTTAHKMWHGSGTEQSHDAVYDFHAKKLAGLWSTLKNTPEGDGTLADSTMVLLVNKNGGSHHNGAFSYWYLTLGSYGGHFKTNQMIEFGFSKKETNDPRLAGRPEPNRIKEYPLRCTSDLFATLAHAMGVKSDTFGTASICKGPIASIIT